MADSKQEDRLRFFWRDKLFTEKFLGGEFIKRNDYAPEKLHPPNNVIEDSEVIFRGPDPLPVLGHLGRLSRLVGLFFDRIADDRETLLEMYDFYKTDLETIAKMVGYLGLLGYDDENWNADLKRRFLRVMPSIHATGGVHRSYINLARLLGFLTVSDHLVARRRFDSVYYHDNIDSRVPAIYFDEMGSLDTWHESFPLALLRWRFYRRSVKSDVGATSIPANRLLTDATAQFGQTCKVGNLITIYDTTDTDDNGEYLVEEIHSDTELKVNADWPTGSLTNLTYTNNWEVPYPDPLSDYLLTRLDSLSPSCMRTMHRDERV